MEFSFHPVLSSSLLGVDSMDLPLRTHGLQYKGRLARLSVAWLLLMCWVPTGIGCSDTSEFDPDVVSAYESFIVGIKTGDGGRLWDLSPPELHEAVEKLRTDMMETAALVREEYPASDQDIALQNLASELYDGTESGREMFVRMFDKESIDVDENVERGLEPVVVRVNGAEAVVVTRGGERFRFEKVENEWRCTTLVAQFEAWPPLGRLRKNAKVAQKNIQSWRRNKQETTDRSKPVGAFNIVLEAVRRGARVTVYEQLDKGSRDILKKAYEQCLALQKALEKRFPAKSARSKHLATRNAAWIERVANEKTLFALLWDQGKFQKVLPPSEGDAKVLRAEAQADDTSDVIVATAAGEQRYRFSRVLGGEWRFAHLRSTIEREGLRFLEAELRAIPAK